MNQFQKRLKTKKPLTGLSLNQYDPVFVDIAGRLGFDIMWIEMEHAPISFREAGDLVRIAQGAGMIAMVRLPNFQRESVLKVAECAPNLLMVPMVRTADDLRDFVRYAMHPPLGERGYYSPARAFDYGLQGGPAGQRFSNENLTLIGQIETVESVEQVDALCQVKGIDGFFLGRADLSVGLGFPGEQDHPEVLAACDRCIQAAKKAGKYLGAVCPPAQFADWTNKGMDMLFVGNNASLYAEALGNVVKTMEAARGQA